jgi:uncharacterized protein (DUF952 family)
MIYHITHIAQWEEALQTGYYTADSLATEGFIHCSRATQLTATANRYYAAQPSILILHISESLVIPPLKDEVATNGEQFPHIYGKLNANAVIKQSVHERGRNGAYSITITE